MGEDLDPEDLAISPSERRLRWGPDLVLRVAVAGQRDFPDTTKARSSLRAVYYALTAILHRVHTRPDLAASDHLAGFYSNATPRLRLVTGLADGADQLAAEVFNSTGLPTVYREMGAILPFDRETTRNHKQLGVSNKDRFDKLLEACEHALELDGDPAREKRSFRGQAAVLVRQCDLLVALADPLRDKKPGGTTETIGRALEIGIPVLLVTGNDEPRLITDRNSEWDLAPFDSPWPTALENRLLNLLMYPPDRVPARAKKPDRPHSTLLSQLFDGKVPPSSFRQSLWQRFEERFSVKRYSKPGGSTGQPGPDPWSFPRLLQQKADDLAKHYAGMYRGTFLLNYLLAVAAVVLAVTALALCLAPLQASDDSRHSTAFQYFPLFVLGLSKLALLLTMVCNTEEANTQGWNQRAISFRYLAERLRAQPFLLLAGCHRPPLTQAARHRSQIRGISTMDWLLQGAARLTRPPTDAANGLSASGISPAAALKAIQQDWIEDQIVYHCRNSRKMAKIEKSLKSLVEGLGRVVLWIVGLELFILVLKVTSPHWQCCLPSTIEPHLHWLSPLLLALAAVLPAAVAAANGIRFQSECARLAERSEQFVPVLAQLLSKAKEIKHQIENESAASPGRGFTLPVLLLAEECAQVMADEAADWSVLYAKEMVETG